MVAHVLRNFLLLGKALLLMYGLTIELLVVMLFNWRRNSHLEILFIEISIITIRIILVFRWVISLIISLLVPHLIRTTVLVPNLFFDVIRNIVLLVILLLHQRSKLVHEILVSICTGFLGIMINFGVQVNASVSIGLLSSIHLLRVDFLDLLKILLRRLLDRCFLFYLNLFFV